MTHKPFRHFTGLQLPTRRPFSKAAWLRWTLFGVALFTLFVLSPNPSQESAAGMVTVSPYEVPPEKAVFLLPLDGLTEAKVTFVAEEIGRAHV